MSSYTHEVTTSIYGFIRDGHCAYGNIFDYCKTVLDNVTTGVSTQKGYANKMQILATVCSTRFADHFGYDGDKMQILGYSVTFDNPNAGYCVQPDYYGNNNSNRKSSIRLCTVGDCSVLTNLHIRSVTYNMNSDYFEVNDYYGESVIVSELPLAITGKNLFTSMYNLYGTNTDGNTSNYSNAILLGDKYSTAYRDYLVKSFKYYLDKDIDFISFPESILTNYNYYIKRFYVSPLPVCWKDSNGNITNYSYLDDGGSWSKYTPEYPPDMSTNWKVYLDGTKMPNIKVVWHNEEIENKKKIENTRINVSFAEVDAELPDTLRTNDFIKTTDVLPYDDGNYKISFKDFYSKCGNGEYDEGISSILPKKSGWLILSIDYYANVTEVLPTASSQKMCARILPSGELVGYYGVWRDETDKSTIKIIRNGIDAETGEEVGDGSEDDGYTDEKDSEENDLQDGQNNSLGVLTSTYNMTRERLNQLGAFLWGANVFDEFSLINSNPIENIVSCKNIPFSIGGTDEVIKLGNVDTGVNGAKISNNFGEMTIGSITVPKKYNSFLDFAPYTKLTIYLPYIGFKELDVTLLMGKTITIKYVVDVITGGCLAEIYVSSTRMYEFSGQVGVDIPITASNRAQVEGAYISNAVGMGASLASGNIQGVASSLVSGAMSKYSYSSTDKPNANCVASANRTCFVIIDRPTYQNLKSFNHTKGRMCNLSKKIGNLKGFTICDKNIDLSGIVATEAEKEELTNILSSGFFA